MVPVLYVVCCPAVTFRLMISLEPSGVLISCESDVSIYEMKTAKRQEFIDFSLF